MIVICFYSFFAYNNICMKKIDQSFFCESEFLSFLENANGRKAFIQKMLNDNGLDAPILQMNDKNHIYVNFPKEEYSKNKSIKTIIAHYDIFPGSPGANDNSFAVYCILKWAIWLHKNYQNSQAQHNVRVIFTDGEECGENGVTSQGAFELAKVFKKLNIIDDDIIVFDCMGRGEVPCICNANVPKSAPIIFKRRLNNLEQKISGIISNITKEKCYKINSNYSDNASFLANGIPAVCITMLPYMELYEYVNSNKIPLTWKLLHSPYDNFDNISINSSHIFFKLLTEILNI